MWWCEVCTLIFVSNPTARDRKNIFWLGAKDFLVKLAGDFFIPICCFKLSYSPEAGGGLPKLVLQLVKKNMISFW